MITVLKEDYWTRISFQNIYDVTNQAYRPTPQNQTFSEDRESLHSEANIVNWRKRKKNTVFSEGGL